MLVHDHHTFGQQRVFYRFQHFDKPHPNGHTGWGSNVALERRDLYCG